MPELVSSSCTLTRLPLQLFVSSSICSLCPSRRDGRNARGTVSVLDSTTFLTDGREIFSALAICLALSPLADSSRIAARCLR